MTLKLLPGEFVVCQPKLLADVPVEDEFWFLSKTDEELSLVCLAESAPENTLKSEAGWRAMRVEGVLDFSLTGILAALSGVLADAGIPIFAVSTYNTDYILVKDGNLSRAIDALRNAGHTVE